MLYNRNFMEGKLNKWAGGAFVHSHLRIEDILNKKSPEVLPGEITKYMRRYTDGSFSLRAITTYLEGLFGENMLVTDTQHPAYVLAENYDDLEDADKVQFFNDKAREQTVELLSECIVRRANLVKKHGQMPNVLTGVEADILSEKGGMTVANSALKELDFVTTSFHSSIWHAAGNEKIRKGTEIIDTYHYIVENQNVDMLSHPTLYVPEKVKRAMNGADWTELLTHMKDANVAYEVNLDSSTLTHSHAQNPDRQVLSEALKVGTPLIIGFDFHYLSDWGVEPSPRLILEPEEARDLFKRNAENGTLSHLLSKVLGNIYALEEMGIRPHDILNSDKDTFIKWLKERNGNL